MDEHLKAAWIAALRAGTYAQTKRRLKRNNRYCCLGVLCEVARLEITGMNKVENRGYAPLEEILGNSIVVNNLITLNDDRAKTFPQIADWIEENL